MGAEVVLGVASDTGSLRIGWASPAHGIARRLAMGAVFAAMLAAGCGRGAPAVEKADAGAAPFAVDRDAVRARASALLDAGATLPDRADLVALADSVAIAAHRAGHTAVTMGGDP